MSCPAAVTGQKVSYAWLLVSFLYLLSILCSESMLVAVVAVVVVGFVFTSMCPMRSCEPFS